MHCQKKMSYPREKQWKLSWKNDLESYFHFVRQQKQNQELKIWETEVRKDDRSSPGITMTVGVNFSVQNQLSLEATKPETRKCVEVFGLLLGW